MVVIEPSTIRAPLTLKTPSLPTGAGSIIIVLSPDECIVPPYVAFDMSPDISPNAI